MSINKEVLDLKLVGNTMEVKATYWMKNNTSNSLSFETAFISQSYIPKDSQNIKIKKNDEVIAHFTRQFIRDYDKNTTWEDEFRNQPIYEKTLGEGTGYKLYTIVLNDKDNKLNFKIKRPATVLGNDSFNKYHEYYQYTPKENIKFITDAKDIDFGGINYEVEEIENIYDYFDDHSYFESMDEESKELILASYLQKVNLNDINEVYYNNYISTAIIYNVDILPNEEITLSVEHNSGTGGRSKNYRHFSYLLSPAKYWNEFKDLTINLTLNKEYPRLKNSSLDFKKEGKYQYSYHSNELPDKELTFSAECTGWQSFKNVLPYINNAYNIF